MIVAVDTRHAPGFQGLEREMEIGTRMNLNELAERMGDCATLDIACIMRDILTTDPRVRDMNDTADVPEALWEKFLSASSLDESPRNQRSGEPEFG